eukprot:7311484-Prymnesium_polylepis.1
MAWACAAWGHTGFHGRAASCYVVLREYVVRASYSTCPVRAYMGSTIYGLRGLRAECGSVSVLRMMLKAALLWGADCIAYHVSVSDG